MTVIGVIFVWGALVALIGGIPGAIAEYRGCTSTNVINALGYLGIFLLPLLWPIGLVWAIIGKTGQCPRCRKGVDARATICPYCRSNLPMLRAC